MGELKRRICRCHGEPVAPLTEAELFTSYGVPYQHVTPADLIRQQYAQRARALGYPMPAPSLMVRAK